MPSTFIEIRRANLRHLRDGMPGDDRGKQRGMAEKLGMSESQLSQLIGKRPTKPIGDRLARSIERRLKLPTGYLDSQFPGISPEAVDFARWYQGLTAEQKQLLKTLRNTAFK